MRLLLLIAVKARLVRLYFALSLPKYDIFTNNCTLNQELCYGYGHGTLEALRPSAAAGAQFQYLEIAKNMYSQGWRELRENVLDMVEHFTRTFYQG